MVETTGRLLRLLSLLQARPSWSGDELTRRLEVTDRTLRRDVTRLRDLGYPVEATPGRHGGYRLVAGGAIPPLLLDDDEAVAVGWGLRAAASGGLPGFEDQALGALTKIEQVLPARVRSRLHDLAEATVRLGWSSHLEAGPEVGLLVTVARARQTPERIRFAYLDREGRQSERHVEPYQLVHAGRRWYLFAWDRDREDWRSFRLDRMSEVNATGMRFSRRESPDAATFVAEGLAVGAYSTRARVRLDLDPVEASRIVPPTVGIMEPDGDGTLMRIGGEVDWIARYLAGLPCRFTVLEPDELRQAVGELGQRLQADSGFFGR